MSRLLSFVDGEYYHIYNRGINKMSIFNDSSDHDRFQKLLYIVNDKEILKPSNLIKSPNEIWGKEKTENLVEIGAYCLMPNHFHILIKSKNKEDTSKFLQRLQLAYSKYFNTKNERSGFLFEGKVKAKHIMQNNYLKYLFSYIHLNPIKIIQKDWKENGIKDTKMALDYLAKYKYSSYLDFVEKRPESSILNYDLFPEYFSTPKIFKEEIFEWLNFKNEN